VVRGDTIGWLHFLKRAGEHKLPIYTNLTEAELIELWQERSAVMEESGMDRKDADRAAYFDLRRLIGSVPVPQVIRDAVRLK